MSARIYCLNEASVSVKMMDCSIFVIYMPPYVSSFISHLRADTVVLGAFTKLRKRLIASCLSVRPSVRMEQLVSHRTDFYEICYLGIFRKTAEKVQVP